MSAPAATLVRPWEQPFWKPMPGKELTFLYLVVIHTLTAVGIVLFPLPSLPIAAAAVALACWGGLGTTVCFHRGLAHRSVRLKPVVEHALILGAMFNGSGAPLSWVTNHRHHHARSDTPDDISSPWHGGGFWWAHLRWLYQAPQPDAARWCPEMNRPAYRVWERLEFPVIVVSLLWALPFGWAAFFWLGAIRLVYSLHGQCLVNSLTHLGHSQDGDHSQNVWWLGPLQLAAWGENWHRNHHSLPGSARFGLRWWQVDVGWYCISALEAVGLASHVHRPTPPSLAS